MRTLGLAGLAPGSPPTHPHPQYKVYPYLLRGVVINRPNQVWSNDITYIRLPRGFVDRVAIIDGYSRKVLAWRLSNTLDASFCVDCLAGALKDYGVPEIFNTDQGAQFTSESFTGLLSNHGITLSMDRYLLLQYLHSPHPCGLRTRSGLGQYLCGTLMANREV